MRDDLTTILAPYAAAGVNRYTLVVDLVGGTVTETWRAPDVEAAMRLAARAHPGARSITATRVEHVYPTSDPWPSVLPGAPVLSPPAA